MALMMLNLCLVLLEVKFVSILMHSKGKLPMMVSSWQVEQSLVWADLERRIYFKGE
jgi:hypothetical protein